VQNTVQVPGSPPERYLGGARTVGVEVSRIANP